MRPRRWLRRILVTAGGLVLLGAAAAWLAPPLLKPWLERAAESELGLSVRVGSVVGPALAGLIFEDVVLVDTGTRPMVRRAVLRRVEVRYSLLAWLAGSSAWIERVAILDPELDLDLAGELPPALRRTEPPDPHAAPRAFPILPALEIAGGRCRLHHGDRTLAFEDVALVLAPDSQGPAGAARGTVRVGRSAWTPADTAPPLPPVAASIVLEPLALTLADIRAGDGPTRRDDRLRIAFDPAAAGAVRIEANLGLLGGVAACRVTLANGRVDGAVKLTDMRTEPAAFFLPPEAPRLAGVFDVDAEIQGRPDDLASLSGTARVALRADRFHDLEAVAATARVDLARGTATVRELDLTSRQGALRGAGELRLDGGLRLELAGDLRPPLPGLGALSAAGAIAVKVTLAGRFAAPELDAAIRGDALAWEAIALRDWEIAAAARREPDGRLAATADARFAALSAPGVTHRNGCVRVTAAGSLVAADVTVAGRGENLRLDLAGRFDRMAPDCLLVTLNDLSASVGRSRLAARGPLTAAIRPDAVELLDPTLTLLDRRATLRGGMAAGRLDLALALAALDLGDLCALAGLERRAAGTVDLDLKLAGTPSAPELCGRVDLHAAWLDLVDLGLPLVRDARLAAALDPGRIRIETCRAALAGGTATARGDIGLAGSRPEHVEGVVAFEQVALAGLAARLGAELAGAASGRIELAGRLAEPQLAARVELRNLAWQGWTDGEVSITARYADGLAHVEALKAKARGLAASGALELPARLSLVPLALRGGPDAAATGRLTLEVGVGSPWHRDFPELAALAGELTLRDRALTLWLKEQGAARSEPRVEARGRLDLDGMRPRALDVTAAVRGLDLRTFRRYLPLGVEGMARATISASGPLDAPCVRIDAGVDGGRVKGFSTRRIEVSAIGTAAALDVYRLEVETGAGLFSAAGQLPVGVGLLPWRLEVNRQAPCRLDLEGRGLDPGRLLEHLGPIRRIEGPLGIEACVRGTLARPEWTGALRLDGVDVRFASESLPQLDRVRGRIVVHPDRVETEGLTVSLGHEQAEIDARIDGVFGPENAGGDEDGRLALGWPELRRFRFAIRGERLLLWRDDVARIRADVDLRCEGDAAGGLVQGVVAPVRSRYLGDIPLTGGAGVPSELSHRLVVPRLETALGRGLRLDVRLRPGDGVLIDTNVARVRARPELELRGTAADPLLEGEIEVAGQLFAPAQAFDLTVGKVRFFARDPLRPYVNAVAEARIAGIEVSALATGPLDRLRIDFASNPSLPREDVAALIMTGAVRGGLTGDNAARVVGTQGLRYLFRRFFPRQRGSEETTFFTDLLDRIYIESIPARTPLDAGNQIRAEFRLFETLFLQGENDKYGDYNGGVLLRLRFGKPAPRAAGPAGESAP
ncbi:MAG: translocation/assembly module TamB domain-containing protein [Planctomycetes bacterium]|nr:translocation/assembly module TamB domain-containing protein [Planctomycetota bacterium]